MSQFTEILCDGALAVLTKNVADGRENCSLRARFSQKIEVGDTALRLPAAL
jgi:hypothetical protein